MKRSMRSEHLKLNVFFFVGMIFTLNPFFAAGQWSVYSSIQFTRGNYSLENSTSTYYLYGGIRYRTPRWNFSASIPLILEDETMMSMIAGPGDLYLFGEYGLLPEQAALPYVSANLKPKIPTAATGNNFGSGEFDYGLGMVLRKSINTYVGFVDLGYWILGDPFGVNYKNPFTIGAGMGRFFGYGRYGLMLYFGSYSNILPEFESNRQISLGFNYRLHPGLTFTVITGAGLSETSPDFLLSSGMEWAL